MAKFTVNSHHAYLNNEIIIRCDGCISIEDIETEEKYTFTDELRIRLKAGRHILKSEDHVEEIFIEDAIKFGGSFFKDGFVFDDSPWVFVIMKDRLYFMNIDTNEEKVEYNITPDNIISLGKYNEKTNDFFLFQTKQDYSLYNISTGKIIKTFTNHIYSNAVYVIYKDNEDYIIYDYRNDCTISKFQGQFSLGNRFYYVNDNKLYGVDLMSPNVNKIDFVGEVNETALLHGNTLLKKSGDYYKQKDSYYKKYIFYELGSGKEDMTRTTLLFPYFIERWFGTDIGDFLHVKEEWNDYSEKNKDNISQNIVHVCYGLRFDNYYINQTKDKSELCFIGEIIRYPDFYGLKNKFILKTEIGSDLTMRYISFPTKDDDENASKRLEDIVKSKIPDGEILISFSNSGNRVLTRKENAFYFYDFNKNYHYSLFGKSFDKSRYSNAYFSSDGKNVVLQISNKECQLLGIESLESTNFEVEGFTVPRINEGFNGYKPEMTFSDRRKPVWRDPITLENITEEDMSKHIFKSPDRKYTANIDKKTILFNRLTKTEIDTKEHLELSKKYNWDENTDDKKKEVIIEQRKLLVKSSDENDLFGKIIEYSNKLFIDVKNVNERTKKIESYIKKEIERYINKASVFTKLFIDRLSYVCYQENKDNAEEKQILIGRSVYYLNYVSFSYDSKYLSFAAKMNTDDFRSSQEGVFVIYDLEKEKIVKRIESFQNRQLLAVWMAIFSKKGDVAFYDSSANAFLLKHETNYEEAIMSPGKSLLCFSPSGRYIACSDQNYIDYTHHPNEKWGHQPSGNVFIHSTDNFKECIEQYNDLGDGIEGVAIKAGNVASAAFSQDEKRLLVVGTDGVVVVRNLKHTGNERTIETHLDSSDSFYEPNDGYGTHYGEYAGTYAQDVMGYSDDVINDAFDGDPDAYWNID